ncbi:hypothetical protein [Bacillus cereus group sp. BfR-BA-01516]|uniref:hypothetical protein n=1 Tax=Bacillus cereus group sp. BfR-BA-01516 TaxID=2920366 RepID=UPI001F5AB34D|nr:hypothetical protein [Bacillus cereus group sp. BfR-BA-01516]
MRLSKAEITFLKKLDKYAQYKRADNSSKLERLMDLGLIGESYGLYYTTKKARDLFDRLEEERKQKIEAVVLRDKTFVVDTTEEINRLRAENEQLKKAVSFQDEFIDWSRKHFEDLIMNLDINIDKCGYGNYKDKDDYIDANVSSLYNRFHQRYKQKFPIF